MRYSWISQENKRFELDFYNLNNSFCFDWCLLFFVNFILFFWFLVFFFFFNSICFQLWLIEEEKKKWFYWVYFYGFFFFFENNNCVFILFYFFENTNDSLNCFCLLFWNRSMYIYILVIYLIIVWKNWRNKWKRKWWKFVDLYFSWFIVG